MEKKANEELRWRNFPFTRLSLWQVLKREKFIVREDMSKVFPAWKGRLRRGRFWVFTSPSARRKLRIFIFPRMHKTQCNFLATLKNWELFGRTVCLYFNWKQFRLVLLWFGVCFFRVEFSFPLTGMPCTCS